jgi:hypothetical protein
MNETQPDSQRQTNGGNSGMPGEDGAPPRVATARARPPHAVPCEADQTADRTKATVSKTNRAPARKAPDDAALAWELAAAAHPHLSRSEADRIYIAIGIGETFTAIDALITAIARDRITLGEELVATVASWLDCYLGQDAEPRLRQLIAEVRTSPPQHISAAKELPGSLPVKAQYRYRRSG